MTEETKKAPRKRGRPKKKKSLLKRVKRSRLIIAGIVFLFIMIQGYSLFLKPNTWINSDKKEFIYIPSGAGYEQVKTLLYSRGLVINRRTFEFTAWLLNYQDHIHSGKYAIKKNMSNFSLVRNLRSGIQEPVRLIFNNIRTKGDLAHKLSLQIEPDSATILNHLNDTALIHKMGFTSDNIMNLFIPNTYEVYWNITVDKLFARMEREHKKFWNRDRLNRAESHGLDPGGVNILASIVEKETNVDDEKPVIAGAYLNRLKKGMRLQADPTIIFAWNDYTIKRVRGHHKQIRSPYNTYLHKGLPPGPICIPSISSIDAVLKADEHDYIYFCAKDDLSGRHVFTASYQEHVRNAKKYRKALDKLNIL